MTHAEAVQNLADYLRDQVGVGDYSQWIVCTEVEFGENRFDVVAINAWQSRSEIRAYEVKVKQSDLDRELHDGKWGAMLTAGAAPYLALAPGLKLQRGDLPPGLGLARLGRDHWRHEVRVEKRLPENAPQLVLEMLRKTRGEMGHLHRARRLEVIEYVTGEKALSEAAQRAAKVAGRDVARWLADAANRDAEAASRASELERQRIDLNDRAANLEKLYADRELMEQLTSAKKLGIEPHVVRQVFDFARASEDAWTIFQAMLRIARRVPAGSGGEEGRR